MGPLLCLPFADRFTRILQLLAFGDPARSGGNRKTLGEFRFRPGPKISPATIRAVPLLFGRECLDENDPSPERSVSRQMLKTIEEYLLKADRIRPVLFLYKGIKM